MAKLVIPKDHALTVQGLMYILKHFPPETPVFYQDENFGGSADPFKPDDIKLEDGKVLIHAPFWYDCNAEE